MTCTDHRAFVARHLNLVFNKFLEVGEWPKEAANAKAIALRKPSPLGTLPTNPACPKEGYRFLQMSETIAKILDAVLTARMIHACAGKDGISTNHQGAFIPGVGTEWHVMALTENIKATWKCRKDIFILFIDLKKAYDMVHPEAMAAKMRFMGFPEKYVKLYLSWAYNRTTSVVINGISTSVPTQMGLGQGAISSPPYFDIFINDLGRYLSQEELGLGVVNLGVKTVLQSFCDDIAIPNYTAEATEKAARAVDRWCNAWGMKMVVGPAKTAVMYCPHPLHRKDPALPRYPVPISLANGTLVPYVELYKYLGCHITPDLKEVPFGEEVAPLTQAQHLFKPIRTRVTELLRFNFARYFLYNSVLRGMDQAGLVQVMNTTGPAGACYLLSQLPPTQDNIEALDRMLHKLQRVPLRLSNSPDNILTLESGIPCAMFLVVRSILSVYYGLKLSARVDPPAVAILRAQLAAGHNTLARKAWLYRLHKFLDPFKAKGAGDWEDAAAVLKLNRPADAADAARAAVVYARIVTAMRVSDLTRKATTRTVALASQRPAPGPSLQHVVDTSLGHLFDQLAAKLPHKHIPLSARIPAGCGNLITRTSCELPSNAIKALAIARCGAAAFSSHPLAPLKVLAKTAAARLDGTANDRYYAGLQRGYKCPLCKAEPELSTDAYHVINQCLHPEMVLAREQLQAAATDYLPVLAKIIAEAPFEHMAAEAREASYQIKQLLESGAIIDWSTSTNKFLLWRLVLVLPFPAACVEAPGGDLCRLFGHLLDTTVARNDRLRKVANSWVAWGSRRFLSVAKRWASLVDECME